MSSVLDRSVDRAPINQPSQWRFLGRSADFWICATLTLIVVLVQGWNIAGYPTVFDDEGTYLGQAWAIDHGIGMAPYPIDRRLPNRPGAKSGWSNSIWIMVAISTVSVTA